jgi:hypothetical protein
MPWEDDEFKAWRDQCKAGTPFDEEPPVSGLEDEPVEGEKEDADEEAEEEVEEAEEEVEEAEEEV